MASLPVTKMDSVRDQLERVHQSIAQRAYELFRGRGDGWGDAFADWIAAEQQVFSRPPVELREKDGAFTVSAALAGVDPKDINVEIAPQDVVIRAEIDRSQSADEGKVHRSEFFSGQIFRSVHFPRAIDMGKAKAEYKNGLLTVTAPIVPEAKAQRLDIHAA